MKKVLSTAAPVPLFLSSSFRFALAIRPSKAFHIRFSSSWYKQLTINHLIRNWAIQLIIYILQTITIWRADSSISKFGYFIYSLHKSIQWITYALLWTSALV